MNSEPLKWKLFLQSTDEEGEKSVGFQVDLKTGELADHFTDGAGKKLKVVYLHLIAGRWHDPLEHALPASFWYEKASDGAGQINDLKVTNWFRKSGGDRIWPKGKPPSALVSRIGDGCFIVFGLIPHKDCLPTEPKRAAFRQRQTHEGG